ncbi:conserved Plasmodium protein, unknown function [Plasmodium malariae]|uniref:tRNA:m(4)X modification enzyme TRM13 n=1 Tax=Plasmodium malariae TaxID=5858 RepID=A0A1C3KCT0_PLAMA|nr:conserved Plasmodium protein, unknown function [Plasmodium malariae]
MQQVCPLEKNKFINEDLKYKSEVFKHLKKCPLFLKNLYLHYNPFYFPQINDSSLYLVRQENVEEILYDYHHFFNETIIHLLKKSIININVTTYEQFLNLKHKFLFKYFLKYGKATLLRKLEDDVFLEKLKKKIGPQNGNHADTISVEGANVLLNYYIEKIKLSIGTSRRGGGSANDSGNISGSGSGSISGSGSGSISGNSNGSNDRAMQNKGGITASRIFNHIAVKESSIPCNVKGVNDFTKKPNVKETAHVAVNSEHNHTKDPFFPTYKDIKIKKKQIEKFDLPILTLKSIGIIHKYKICREIIKYVDKNIFFFLNGKKGYEKTTDINNSECIFVNEKENLDEDEILSIVIYVTIYLCCNMSIMKRIKNKNFNREQKYDSTIEMSIYFFLENIDKHDIQNINLLFLLLYFNKIFFEYFYYYLLCKEKKKKMKINFNLRNMLFVELGAGKGNTARWVNFVMNILTDVLAKFSLHIELKDGKRKNDYPDSGEKKELTKFISTPYTCMENKQEQPQTDKCKILIIEKDSRRNKKEKKDFYMQIAKNYNTHTLRIKADIADFHLSKFLRFVQNGKAEEQNIFLIPDIVHFYYCKDVYWKREQGQRFLSDKVRKLKGGEECEKGKEGRDGKEEVGEIGQIGDQEGANKRTNYYSKMANLVLSEKYLKNNLLFLESYFDVHVKKIFLLLTQGNNDLIKVYNNMNDFLKNVDFQKVTFITKHLCGNGTDLALRMIMNSTKNEVLENYFILAPCCHHRCEVQKILGFEYLKKLNIDKKHFQYMVNHMSGYASCDSKMKKSVGKKIKLLIDLTRLLYLLEKGLQNAYIIKYVSRRVTIENYAFLFFNHQNLNLCNFKHF